jgi:hypothetical protein
MHTLPPPAPPAPPASVASKRRRRWIIPAAIGLAVGVVAILGVVAVVVFAGGVKGAPKNEAFRDFFNDHRGQVCPTYVKAKATLGAEAAEDVALELLEDTYTGTWEQALGTEALRMLDTCEAAAKEQDHDEAGATANPAPSTTTPPTVPDTPIGTASTASTPEEGFPGGDGSSGDPYTDALLQADTFEDYWVQQLDEEARRSTCDLMAATAGNLTYNMLFEHNLHNGSMWDGRTGSAYVEWLRQSQSCRPYAMSDDYRLDESTPETTLPLDDPNRVLMGAECVDHIQDLLMAVHEELPTATVEMISIGTVDCDTGWLSMGVTDGIGDCCNVLLHKMDGVWTVAVDADGYPAIGSEYDDCAFLAPDEPVPSFFSCYDGRHG